MRTAATTSCSRTTASTPSLARRRPLLGRDDALGQARAIDALYRAAASGSAVEL